MSSNDTKEEAAFSAGAGAVETPKDEPHKYADTAMGLDKALTKATLTPVVGLFLMGVAAHDAIASISIGAMHKAGDLIGHTDKDADDLKPRDAKLDPFQGIMDRKDQEPRRPLLWKCSTCTLKMQTGRSYTRSTSTRVLPFFSERKMAHRLATQCLLKKLIPTLVFLMTTKFENIDDIIKKVLPRTYRAYWPLWFQGNYKSGLVRVDLGPGSTNFYCLQRGKKDVVIADYDGTWHLHMKTGIDNLYCPDSSGNHDYLQRLPKYYRVTLEENSILIFNNSGCLHHFTNVIEEGVTPISLSVRCKNSLGSDPRGWLHSAADLKVW
jgi:hypothetical protein